MVNKILSPGQKAKRTGQWAKIMTKWLISYATKGSKKWQFVSFEGSKGGESTGIVDFVAIRRNHNPTEHPLKKGDLFEIILIQVKGGSALMPNNNDNERLVKVGEQYKAKRILLSEWKKGNSPVLYSLENNAWNKIAVKEAFS